MSGNRNRSGGSGFPFRAFWAWPLAAGLVGILELVAFRPARPPTDSFLPLSLGSLLLLGVLPGAIGLLVSLRFGPALARWSDAAQSRLRAYAASFVVSIFLAVGALSVVGLGLEFWVGLRFDFKEDQIRWTRLLLLLAVPMSFLGAVGLSRFLDARRLFRRFALGICRITYSLLALAILALGTNLLAGVYIPGLATVGMMGLAASLFGLWLPVSLGRGWRGAWICLGPLLAVVPAGAVGLSLPESRAYLLHDTRLIPWAAEVLTAPADWDGDSITALWAGGRDCDDADAEVSPARPEVPGNGVDDNCGLGDASVEAFASKTASAADGLHGAPVFFISLDAVRAQQLRAQGYGRDTLARTEAFAQKRCLRFRRAYSPSNHTKFSMMSIISGQSPEFLARQTSARERRVEATHWLPSTLADAGYETWLFRTPDAAMGIQGRTGFLKRYNETLDLSVGRNRGTSGAQVRQWVAEFLRSDAVQSPVFAWINLYDAHATHESAGPYSGGTDLVDAYDNEISFTDLQLSLILKHIDRRFTEAIIVIFADHGEALGKHGLYGHGWSLRESEIHVPLYVCAPGVDPAERVDVVSVAGLPATILELLGLSIPAEVQYPSLLRPAPAPSVLVGTPFFSRESRMEVALVEDRFKLTHNRRQGTYVLTDLVKDPGETQNLVGSSAEVFDRMWRQMRRQLEHLR